MYKMIKMENWSELYSTNVNDHLQICMDKIARALNSITTTKKSNAKNKHIKE